MTDLRPLLGAALLALLLGTVHAEPTAPTPPDALPVEADWKARSDAWFDAKDEAGRRKEMRAVTRALRQPCRYCHTPDFSGYTDKRLVSQQMMALSAEHGVECEDCHAGKTELTPFGQKAAPMWALARDQQTFCGTCHVKHRRFEALTERGKTFRDEAWPAWQAAHEKATTSKAATSKAATKAANGHSGDATGGNGAGKSGQGKGEDAEGTPQRTTP